MEPSKALAYRLRWEAHGNVSEETVCARLRQEGFRVFRFGNGGVGDELIKHLNAQPFAAVHQAFTVNDQRKNQFVFIRWDVSANHRLFLLLHELGHVLLKHRGEDVLSGSSVVMEQQANRFAEYAINPNYIEYGLYRMGQRRKTALVIGALLVAVTAGAYYVRTEYYETVYITRAGECYHRENCGTIRGADATAVTPAEAKEMGKRACQMCNPR